MCEVKSDGNIRLPKRIVKICALAFIVTILTVYVSNIHERQDIVEASVTTSVLPTEYYELEHPREFEKLPKRLRPVAPEPEVEIVQVSMALAEVEPKQVSRGSLPNRDLILVAKTVQSEALDEPYLGKVAVAAVILNRRDSDLYPDTVREVIYQKKQFSGVNGRLFNQDPSDECIQAVEEALEGHDPTNGALYFVNLKLVNPKWLRKLEFVDRIGDHWFYK